MVLPRIANPFRAFLGRCRFESGLFRHYLHRRIYADKRQWLHTLPEVRQEDQDEDHPRHHGFDAVPSLLLLVP